MQVFAKCPVEVTSLTEGGPLEARFIKEKQNHLSWTSSEEVMIHQTVDPSLSRKKALELFADLQEDSRPGYYAGSVSYYMVGRSLLSVVSYGAESCEVETGAVFEFLSDGSTRKLAKIQAGMYLCD